LPAAPVEQTVLDSDADGVADAVDACPSSNAGAPVNASGCALFNGVIEGINFESGSDTLTASSEGILAGEGSADSNLQLSKRRAIAVARYLVEQGVPGQRLQPQAFGESQPRESNATSAGRAKNRRVEFQVVQ